MAKKEETISMVDTFSEFKELKNIDRTTMISVLEESFRNVLSKMFGTDANFDVIVNPDKGDFEIWRNREVVADEDVTDTNLQISLSEAKKIDEDYEIGEEVTDEVFFEKFGRRAILNLRQTLASKILELQKEEPELFSDIHIKEYKAMLRHGVEEEIRWAAYVIGNDIEGLTMEMVSDYIKYLGNLRSNSLGFGILYEGYEKEPASMEWVSMYSNANLIKTDFFEARSSAYAKSSALVDDL